jgi:hypothetical protein
MKEEERKNITWEEMENRIKNVFSFHPSVKLDKELEWYVNNKTAIEIILEIINRKFNTNTVVIIISTVTKFTFSMAKQEVVSPN